MTLARTALRVVTTAALKGATIAGPRVYDSRNTDIAPEEYSEDAKPMVVVFTDKDEGDAQSDQNGGPPFYRNIDLVFEIGMIARATTYDKNDKPNGFVVGYPDTDARLEASLDLLEFQVVRTLSYDLGALPILFRKIARITKYNCHRQVEDTPGVTIACRILTLTCLVQDDRVKVFNTASPPVGAEVLPEPLRTVATALPANGAAADIVAGILSDFTPIAAEPLEGVDIEVGAPGGREGVPPVKTSIDLSQ